MGATSAGRERPRVVEGGRATRPPAVPGRPFWAPVVPDKDTARRARLPRFLANADPWPRLLPCFTRLLTRASGLAGSVAVRGRAGDLRDGLAHRAGGACPPHSGVLRAIFVRETRPASFGGRAHSATSPGPCPQLVMAFELCARSQACHLMGELLAQLA